MNFCPYGVMAARDSLKIQVRVRFPVGTILKKEKVVEFKCEKCGEDCYRDEVDVEVGIIYGPWGCSVCGWSEHPEYDRSEGTSPAQAEDPEWYVDQFGGKRKISSIADCLARFGIPKELTEEVFKVENKDDEKK